MAPKPSSSSSQPENATTEAFQSTKSKKNEQTTATNSSSAENMRPSSKGLRLRSDSTDSVRGAFYHQQDMPSKSGVAVAKQQQQQQHNYTNEAPTNRPRRHKKPKKPKVGGGAAAGASASAALTHSPSSPPQQQPAQPSSSSMADIAGLAFAEEGLSGFAAAAAAGSSTSETTRLNNNNNGPTTTTSGVRTSSRRVHYGSAAEQNPLSSLRVEGPIRDGHGISPRRGHVHDSLRYSGADLPGESLRYSQSHADLPDDSLLQFLGDYSESSRQSDGMGQGGQQRPTGGHSSYARSSHMNSYLKSGISERDSMALPPPPALDVRGSLYGTDFLNDESPTSSAAVTPKDSRHSSSVYSQQQPEPVGYGSFPAGHLQTSTAAPSAALHRNQSQQQDIALFSSMAQGNFGGGVGQSVSIPPPPPPPPPSQAYESRDHQKLTKSRSQSSYSEESDYLDESDSFVEPISLWTRLGTMLNPNVWLTKGVKVTEDGKEYFDKREEWTLAGFVRHYFYNPISPEFTSLQQFDWAVVIGIVMGFYTAIWKYIIESSVDFMWETVPELLLKAGVFTDAEGSRPLYLYMVICPALLGGLLSYEFVRHPVPDQNDWISNVHTRGVQDYRSFWRLFVLSTAGMASGLSLGPELPLVLTAGMAGSWLGLVCQQSILQARVLNLTSASAAIGGFFGFPMAGALFVLELPHRMGLQYFEALSPATISSIVAVLCNRLVTGNDVTGYFSYPFLTATLPSEIFTNAIIYGLYGAAIGIGYAKATKKLKVLVHDLFHAPHDDHNEESPPTQGSDEPEDEKTPFIAHQNESASRMRPKHQKTATIGRKSNSSGHMQRILACLRAYFCCVIPDEAIRATCAGVLAGAVVGCTGLFVPHVLFWGEAQLQTLIDKGRTPLPVFGVGSDLAALGRCMIDPTDPDAVKAGHTLGCSALISIAKIFVTGISLGTGIIGGHFWGPLFVGCAASHFLTDVVHLLSERFGFDGGLAAYPCVVMLCTMGSTHVVTFRAHMAIMLILTLTISAFDPEDENSNFNVAGDYSAVFPLLVVSVFISLMVSRQTVFYPTQRSRGDIIAVPEVLCEPGLEGTPLVLDYDVGGDDFEEHPSDEVGSEVSDIDAETGAPESVIQQVFERPITQSDIEKEFEETNASRKLLDTKPMNDATNVKAAVPPLPPLPRALDSPVSRGHSTIESESVASQLPPLSSSRLDELLSRPMDLDKSLTQDVPSRLRNRHRRTVSAPVYAADAGTKSSAVSLDERLGVDRAPIVPQPSGNRQRSNSSNSKGSLVHVSSFGELSDHQPSLMDQARKRAASAHRRAPSLPSSRHSRKNSGGSFVNTIPPLIPKGRHSRKNSESSVSVLSLPGSPGPLAVTSDSGALTLDDIEQTFNSQIVEIKPDTIAFNVMSSSAQTNISTSSSSDGELLGG